MGGGAGGAVVCGASLPAPSCSEPSPSLSSGAMAEHRLGGTGGKSPGRGGVGRLPSSASSLRRRMATEASRESCPAKESNHSRARDRRLGGPLTITMYMTRLTHKQLG
jgi:hypothetical protein